MEATYDPLVFNSEYESVHKEKFIIATYYVEHKAEGEILDHLNVIQPMLLQGSTGTWQKIPEDTAKIRELFTPKVIGYYPVPTESENHKKAIVNMALHTESFSHNFPMLLIAIAGNILFFPGVIKLVGIHFPKSFCQEFTGPKFGISGIRKLLGVPERPFVLTIIKPKMGMTPQETAEQAYKAAIGGSDMVKDDEMCSETFNCSFKDRVRMVSQALKRAYEENGQKTLYFVSITDRPSKMKHKAKLAIEMGAGGLLVGFTAGYSVIRDLAKDSDINVPILMHPTSVASQTSVFRFPVICKLARLAGADLVLNATRWATLPFVSLEDGVRANQILQAPMYHINPSLSAPSGGMHPGLVPELVKECGPDIFIPAGGGIHGHPKGTTAGAKAMRQAIEATMREISLEEASKAPDNRELKDAVEKFGIFHRPTTRWFRTVSEWENKTSILTGYDYSK